MSRPSFTVAMLITASTLVCAGMRAAAEGTSQAIAVPQQSETDATERATQEAATQEAQTQEAQTQEAQTQEAQTQEALCSTCHEANLVEGTFRMPEEWDDTLGRMKSFGAQGTEEQFNQIRSFLLRKYGRAKINTATAKDLSPVLDVPPDLAEAVVAHRRDNGPFKSLDDLKKVPGLDATQVDARKARLMF